MKKIVIGSIFVVMAAVVHAQVGVTGKVSMWHDTVKSAGSTTNIISLDPTSNVAVSFNETIGRDLAVRGVVETSLEGNTLNGLGTMLGDRQATLGLRSKLGTLDAGRNVHSHFVAVSANDPFGTLVGSVTGDVHNLRGLRFSDAVFVSTTFSGVTMAADRQVGTGAWSASAIAKFMGANVTVAHFDGADNTSNVVGVRYSLGGTTLYGTWSEDTTGTVKTVGRQVGATHAIGPIIAKISVASTNRGVDAYAVGADYALGKRTQVGAAYRSVQRVGSSDTQQLLVGMTHRF